MRARPRRRPAMASASKSGKPGGELEDLRARLRSLAGSAKAGAAEAKRETFRKVVSHMTVSIDVSALFTEVRVRERGCQGYQGRRAS